MVEDGSSFEAALAARSAADYADFLIPHLAGDSHVLDVGCGSGEISIGIAPMVRHVIGVDLEEEGFAAARTYARVHGIANIEFRTGSVYELELPDRMSRSSAASMRSANNSGSWTVPIRIAAERSVVCSRKPDSNGSRLRPRSSATAPPSR
ncbi:MAG: class I SAM-dependent methyltransferase [Actinomycetota bacterium]